MTPPAPRTPFDLHHPPRLRLAGVGVHGHRPVERWRLPELHCMHLYSYDAELIANGCRFPIRPGYLSLTQPDDTLEYHFRGRSQHIYAHFALDRAPDAAGHDVVWFPVMQDLGDELGGYRATLEQIVACFPTQPRCADAILWQMLWRLADRQGGGTGDEATPHPAVVEAMRYIELHLGEPLRVADLARRVGVSHNHLTRLFRQATGDTVQAYLRRRRVDRACHLLRHATRPAKAIAVEVGIPDLQQFNKTIRRATGRPPSAHRE